MGILVIFLQSDILKDTNDSKNEQKPTENEAKLASDSKPYSRNFTGRYNKQMAQCTKFFSLLPYCQQKNHKVSLLFISLRCLAPCNRYTQYNTLAYFFKFLSTVWYCDYIHIQLHTCINTYTSLHAYKYKRMLVHTHAAAYCLNLT